MKRIYIYLLLIPVVVFLVFEGYKYLVKKPTPAPEQELQTEPTTAPSETPSEEPSLPSTYELKVPFVSQAPFGVWDDLHNNACEEVSILLVHYYKKKKSLTAEQADKEIKEMVDWEIKKYGRHKDLTVEETANLAKEFYGYKNVRVVYDFSWDDVKRELVKGNPVIVPAAGRLLKNPYFRQPGPIYHMFVIKGYTGKEIITNDVGTRRGEGFRYSYSILDRAIHDWNGSPKTIEQGKRAMIVLEN